MAKIGVQSATEFLKDILVNNYYIFIEIWLKNATSREIDGLKIFREVYQSRGLIRLAKSTALRRSLLPEISHPQQHTAKLDFQPMLTEKAKTYLQSWLSIETSRNYVSLVMSFLKGFHSLTALDPPRRSKPTSPRSMDLSTVKDFSTAFQLASPRDRKYLQLKGNEELKECARFIHHENKPLDIAYKSHSFKVNPDFQTSLISRRLPEPQLNYRLY